MTTATGHLSKKELQSDEVLNTAKSGLDWLRSHGRETIRAASIAGGVVAIVLVVWGAVAWRKHSAGSLLSDALATLDAPVGAGEAGAPGSFVTADARSAKAAELFEKAAGYGSTPAGQAAALDRASAMAAKGDTAGAWALLEKTASGSTGLVRAYAEYGLMLIGPSAGKTKETIERINRMLAETDPAIPSDVLLFTLGEVYQKDGKVAEAKGAWQQLVTRFPDSRLRFEAQQKLQAL